MALSRASAVLMQGRLAPTLCKVRPSTCLLHQRILPSLPSSQEQHRYPCSQWAPLHICHATSSAGPSSSSSPEDSPKSTPAKPNTVLTLPTILTLGRVAAIPVLIGAWYWPSPSAPLVCTTVFILASLTDWLDGYLARKMKLSSAFGAFLDPVADKLMVAAVLILMCTRPLAAGPLAGNDWLVPAMTLAIIGRELTMSALREWAATLGPEARSAVAVNAWGKWKTTFQMVALTMLLLARDGGDGPLVQLSGVLGPVFLGISACLTVWSLVIYMRGLWRFMF